LRNQCRRQFKIEISGSHVAVSVTVGESILQSRSLMGQF
jgi:hypothetical protein